MLLIFLVKLIVLGREGILKPHRCGPLNKCTLELANFFFLSCITFLLLLLPLSLLLHWLILALSSATSKSSTLFHLRTNDNRYEKLYTANIYTFIDTSFFCVRIFYSSSSTSLVNLVNIAKVQFTVVLLYFNYVLTVFVYSLSFILAWLMYWDNNHGWFFYIFCSCNRNFNAIHRE